MGKNISQTSLVSRRYASALLDTAEKAKKLNEVEKDIKALEAMIAGSADLQLLIKNPVISRKDKEQAVVALAKKAKFHQLTQNFLAVLVQNGRLNELSTCLRAVYQDLATRRGGVQAQVQTAYALTDKQTKALKKQLDEAMKTDVMLDVSVNKDLLGGMVVTVGSLMIDDSVSRKLDRLKRVMKSGSNQTQLKEVG